MQTCISKHKELTFDDLFPDKTEGEPYHPIIQSLKDKEVMLFSLETEVQNVINEMKIGDILTDAKFDRGMLSLLSVQRGSETITGGDINVSEMTTAINNMSATLKTKTLFELKGLGIITTDDEILQKRLGVEPDAKAIGDCTIEELITEISKYAH